MDATPVPTMSSDACVIVAAQEQGVPPDLMLAVRSVERGTPGKYTTNTDGSRDHNEPGLNTRTVRDLRARGWDAERLLHDGCYAMSASAFWMRLKLLDVRGRDISLLSRAARYNSATSHHNANYQAVLVPALRDWSCYLHHHWKTPAQALFSVASNVTTEQELTKCNPKKNLF